MLNIYNKSITTIVVNNILILVSIGILGVIYLFLNR